MGQERPIIIDGEPYERSPFRVSKTRWYNAKQLESLLEGLLRH